MTPSTLLVVDDEPLNLAVLTGLLSPHYRVLGARTGPDALSLAAAEQPDLILLDVMMPGMDGRQVLATLQQQPHTRHIPVIFITALGREEDEEQGLALGAVDYVVKPIKPGVVLARVRTQLELKQTRDRLSDQNTWLERELARRVSDMLLAQELMLAGMAELAETRDRETGNHVLRTQRYVELLARQLQRDAEVGARLSENELQHIVKASPMHDIGKIGIPDTILLKPGVLTPEEYAQMKRHARLGADAIGHAISRALAALGLDRLTEPAPEPLRFLETARQIALHHHERWDGSGYPDGLVGEAIPLGARLMAVADVYDALVTPRVYKRAWAVEDAERLIMTEAGRQFDPAVVRAFTAIRPQLAAIATQLHD